MRLFGVCDAAGNWLDAHITSFTTAAPIAPTLTKTGKMFDADEPWGMLFAPARQTLAVSSNY